MQNDAAGAAAVPPTGRQAPAQGSAAVPTEVAGQCDPKGAPARGVSTQTESRSSHLRPTVQSLSWEQVGRQAAPLPCSGVQATSGRPPHLTTAPLSPSVQASKQ